MNDRRESSSSEEFSPQQAVVTPVDDSRSESLAAVLASPQAMTLIGGLTQRFRSLGVRPPRYPQALESSVVGGSWASSTTKDRNLLFSVAHHSAMEMLLADGSEQFNRSRDKAEISGVALLEREGARSGGTDRMWFFLQSLGGHLAASCLELEKDCRVELRHAKAFNWVPEGTKSSSILTSTCFRIRYEGLSRAELNQILSDAMSELGTTSRAERLSLHQCFHA